MLQIALTNLGKYNEGELCYKWLDLPCSFSDYVDALEEIGIDGVEYEEVFISDVNTDIDGLYDKISEYSDVELLNWLGGKLEEMADWEIENLEALLENGEHTDGILEIIDCCDAVSDCDCAMVLSDVDDDEDLGRYWIEESGCYDLSSMGNLAEYFDYERFGRDVRLEEGGCHTDHGYVVVYGSSWSNYSKDDLPVEYELKGAF